jgi:tetratricopeptide (TPR) repeat protein
MSLAAAASLLSLPADHAERVLRGLLDSGLAAMSPVGRYRACAMAEPSSVPAAERETALRRLVDYYLHTAYAADRLLWPSHPSVELAPPAAGCVPDSFPSQEAALAWLDTEHECLIAIRRAAVKAGFHSAVWQLAATLKAHFVLRGRTREQVEQWREALAAAQALGDKRAEALALRFYGQACSRAGMHEEAVAKLRAGVQAAVDSGDAGCLAQTHYMFAWVLDQSGQLDAAVNHAERARELFRAAHQVAEEAEALNAAGWYHAQLGHHAEAAALCGEALELARAYGHREAQAAALDSLAVLAERAGMHANAIAHYRDALGLCRDFGNTYQEAGVLDRLGDAYAAVGYRADALQAWHQALELYRDQHRVEEAALVERRLTSTAGMSSQPRAT